MKLAYSPSQLVHPLKLIALCVSYCQLHIFYLRFHPVKASFLFCVCDVYRAACTPRICPHGCPRPPAPPISRDVRVRTAALLISCARARTAAPRYRACPNTALRTAAASPNDRLTDKSPSSRRCRDCTVHRHLPQLRSEAKKSPTAFAIRYYSDGAPLCQSKIRKNLRILSFDRRARMVYNIRAEYSPPERIFV